MMIHEYKGDGVSKRSGSFSGHQLPTRWMLTIGDHRDCRDTIITYVSEIEKKRVGGKCLLSLPDCARIPVMEVASSLGRCD